MSLHLRANGRGRSAASMNVVPTSPHLLTRCIHFYGKSTGNFPDNSYSSLQITKSYNCEERIKMRLPYVSDPTKFTDAEDKDIEARIRERRGSRGLIPLDRALLHSPPVADGW